MTVFKKWMSGSLSLYWICQISGWGAAALYWSYYQIRDQYSLLVGVLSVVVSFVVGIGSTHYYKKLAHREKWIFLSLKKLMPRLLLALIVLTAIYVLVGYISVMLRVCYFDMTTFLGMLTGGLRYIAIWLLAFHLYHYARMSRQAEIDQNKFEKLALEAQLDKLNGELNPHFLFNALNSIKALTLENPEAAREGVDLLSDMLRSSLQLSKKRLVPLSDELERIEAYLALEKIRFEDRLKYTFQIDENSKAVLVPPLSLYNLVENAVKHGISQMKAGGHILIAASKVENQLHLMVQNDGTLNNEWVSGVGIQNVLERSKLTYKVPAQFTLRGVSDRKVEAKLILPVRE